MAQLNIPGITIKTEIIKVCAWLACETAVGGLYSVISCYDC